MATLRIPIFGPDMRLIPGTVNGVSVEPTGRAWTESAGNEMILVFGNTSTKDAVHGSFEVPDDYSASTTDPAIVIPWAIPGTGDDVVFDFDYNAIAVGEDIDPTSFTQSLTVTDTAPGTADLLQSAEITLARAGIAALDIIRFIFARDGADVADDIAASVYVWMDSVMFRYDDA